MGKILAVPDIEPAGGSKCAHWQADERGKYVDRLRAYLYSDKDGNYQLKTERPNLHVRHIHFIVTNDDHQVPETQWVGTQRKDRVTSDDKTGLVVSNVTNNSGRLISVC